MTPPLKSSFVIALALLLPATALAQTRLEQARAHYETCRTLLKDGQPCEALRACEKGLEVKSLNVLKDLAVEARKACRKKRRPRKPKCPSGQAITSETEGHCCWSGQVWERNACVGLPTACPEGFVINEKAQACESPQESCSDDGKVLTSDGHCCWPGQGFSDSQNRCVGIPLCPALYDVEGELCVLRDTDADGTPDAQDACPELAEDFDDFEDDDACPEPDNDRDGICDPTFPASIAAEMSHSCLGSDACPLEPEDNDDFQDADGCPDLDNDNDGILDEDDACAREAEDLDGYEDTDGCPEDTEEERLMRNPPTDLSPYGWAAVGTGSTLLLVGVALHVVAALDRSALENPERNAFGDIQSLTEKEAYEREERANTLMPVALASYGVGGALVATGVVLLLLNEGGDAQDPSLSVGWKHGGWWLQLEQRF